MVEGGIFRYGGGLKGKGSTGGKEGEGTHSMYCGDRCSSARSPPPSLIVGRTGRATLTRSWRSGRTGPWSGLGSLFSTAMLQRSTSSSCTSSGSLAVRVAIGFPQSSSASRTGMSPALSTSDPVVIRLWVTQRVRRFANATIGGSPPSALPPLALPPLALPCLLPLLPLLASPAVPSSPFAPSSPPCSTSSSSDASTSRGINSIRFLLRLRNRSRGSSASAWNGMTLPSRFSSSTRSSNAGKDSAVRVSGSCAMLFPVRSSDRSAGRCSSAAIASGDSSLNERSRIPSAGKIEEEGGRAIDSMLLNPSSSTCNRRNGERERGRSHRQRQ